MNCEEKAMEKEAKHEMQTSESEEQTRICTMRALVETHDPSSKEVDDVNLRRFLRAREQNVEKASAMFLKYLKWRKTYVPNGSIPLSEIPNEISQNKMFIQGFDKERRPIGVALGARHFKNKGGVDEFKRFAVCLLDKLCARMPPGQEKFLIIGDLQGWGYSNTDLHACIGALGILQDYYPERLGKLLIVHAPYIFMQMWKIVYPFIDNKTKKKIVFVESKRLKTTLLQDIKESELPEIYGGKLPLVPFHQT